MRRPRRIVLDERDEGVASTNLKRNLVLVRFGWLSRFGWRAGFAAARLALGFRPFARRGGWAAAEQLHGFADDAQLAAFLAGLFVIPSVHLQSAFDKHRAALP